MTTTQYDDLVNRAVAPIGRRFRRYVNRQDLVQECWLWVVANESKAKALLEQSEAFLVRRLRSVAERYARTEKAVKVGYSPDDEYHYSLTQLAGLLHDAFEPDATPPQDGYSEVGSGGGKLTFSEWETVIADVRAGLRKIALHHYHALYEYVQGRKMLDDVEVKLALRALRWSLGGPRPEGE